ncbi:hypothetical protein HRbin28_00166 [bacterium HR28]|nr:hypothetical protein HRbin28_00166 [bacterium HR28]
MGKRLVHLLLAVAMAVSAFAGLTIAPAGAAQEVPSGTIYFPWVPNGEEYAGMGPWYSSVTIQNFTEFPVRANIYKADGTKLTSVTFEPWASKSWSSADLFGNGSGAGVFVDAAVGPLTVTRGDTDIDSVSVGRCVVQSVSISQGATVFVQGVDYIWSQTGSRLDITWIGSAPAAGTDYTVNVACDGLLGGVVKMAAPQALISAAWTGTGHESVTGYTSLPVEDVWTWPRSWVFPIIQTNNGWNSVMHITNFGGGNCSVNVDLYQTPTRAGAPGASGPSEGHFSELLAAGETWHIDLVQDYGWPADWIGTAFITADCGVAASVDRLKAAQPWGDPVNMAVTNVAQPTFGNWSEVYAPLVYQNYNGWNTGISIVNLDPDFNNNVQVQFYNRDGTLVHSESLTIPPRAMEWLYLPERTDLGTQGLSQAVIRSLSGLNLAAAVDSVKYTGIDQDVGQATSYLAQQGTRAARPGEGAQNGLLSVALFQKQFGLTAQQDNSGIAYFNANTGAPATVEVTFYDGAGFRVAPTLVNDLVINLPPAGGGILYAPWYGEMPFGFRGSVVLEVTQGGPVACVSNNVNYQVQFDGTATYNCFIREAVDGAVPRPEWTLEARPANAANLAARTVDTDVERFQHTVTAVVRFAGQPQTGVPVLFEILNGSRNDDPAENDQGTYNPAGDDDVVVNTNNNGVASWTYQDGGAANTSGVDTILVCADVNGNSQCDPGEPRQTVRKVWATATVDQGQPPQDAGVVGDNTEDLVLAIDVDPDQLNAGLPLVLRIVNETGGDVSFAVCNQPDRNVQPWFVSADTNVPLYICADPAPAGGTFQVEAYWDVNANGQVDAGVDVPLIGSPVNFTW